MEPKVGEWEHKHGVAKRHTTKEGSFTAVCLVLNTAANGHWTRSEDSS
ncbi:rCG46866, isoform CRA_b [Rattus norvegicus]|uniref:RCG46866, isoform CRA_b n=1 Tax=Rattus norvegicus TaxID=10116 RepID=A6IXI8_RAT|nr:rCG46866, isoform CRA_b [Rattus norvegicus]